MNKYKKIKQSKKSIKNQKKKWFAKYRKYLLSDEWAQIRIDLFNHRGKQCELCLSKNKLEVHHLTYKNIFNEEPEDLMILCKSCHKKQHK